ncbi:hypothetical protein AAMO2058_001236000 [Amorphochlora amoebiformis]
MEQTSKNPLQHLSAVASTTCTPGSWEKKRKRAFSCRSSAFKKFQKRPKCPTFSSECATSPTKSSATSRRCISVTESLCNMLKISPEDARSHIRARDHAPTPDRRDDHQFAAAFTNIPGAEGQKLRRPKPRKVLSPKIH